MIEKVLERARTRGSAADTILRDSATLSLKFESGRLKESALSQEAGLNLRVFANGKVGIAGTTDLAALDDVVQRAFASAEEGEPLAAELPGKLPLPPVNTWDDRAAGLDVAALAAIGRALLEPLTRPGWQVGASVDRVVETLSFANTAGQIVSYRSTAVSFGAEVTRVAGDDVLMAYDGGATVGVPEAGELERLTRHILVKMARSEKIVDSPEGRLPVLFTPEGSSCVWMPIRMAVSGKTVLQGVSPLGGKIGEKLFDSAVTFTDDPTALGRVASRPADDEGVPSKPLAMIEQGVVRAFVYDLETAARASTKSTGHGARSTFGKPGISFSNTVLATGTLDEAGLLCEMKHGLIVDELIGVGQGNVVGGAFSHPVALAWRVDGGEITGRVKDAAIAGNAYDLLKNIRAFGSEARWLGGTRLVPPLLLDEVNVAGR